MKNAKVLIPILVAILSTGSLFGAGGGAGCEESSWNPELYSFYGAKANIIEKVSSIHANLPKRRVFVQITQGASRAEVRLYEKQGDGKYSVTEWNTKDAADLIGKIDKSILANKGVNCVGEQVKSILAKQLGSGKVSNAIPAPESPKAAFAHPVKNAQGDFVKTTVIILC